MEVMNVIERPMKLLKYTMLYVTFFISFCLMRYALEPLIDVLKKLSYNSLPFMFEGVAVGVAWGVEMGLLLPVLLKAEGKHYRPKHKKMSIKNILIVSVLTALPIIVFAATTDFNVKVFYDIGYSIYIGPNERAFVNKLGILPLHIATCFWIVLIMLVSDRISVLFDNKYVQYIIFGVLLLAFGMYDAIAFHAYYGGISYFFTYMLFYISFGIIYQFLNKNTIIMTLLVLLIYLI
ncbi:MAG: hypothetical protein K6E20_04585 [Acholeplasmatales bacterium]|nr:hypothetical protein [Acholeplasmatales bacterium]